MFDEEFLLEQKNELMNEKRRLEEEVAGSSNEEKGEGLVPEFPNYGTEDEDETQEIEQALTNSQVGGDMEEMLGDVELALSKIENGSYGTCENCGGQISRERLEAFPAAKICLDCESKE